MSRRSRLRVVLPLEEQPLMPMMVAFRSGLLAIGSGWFRRWGVVWLGFAEGGVEVGGWKELGGPLSGLGCVIANLLVDHFGIAVGWT